MDRQLLKKYMRLIIHEEGYSYLSRIPERHEFREGAYDFTDEEVRLLEEIEREIKSEDGDG